MATKQINEFTAVGSSALTDQLLTETAANATRKCTLSQVFALLDDQALTWTAAQAFGAAVTMATTLGVTGAATFGSTVGVTGTLTAGNLATGGTLAATGAATLGSTLAVTGAATLSSTLAAGASTLASLAVTAGATIGTTLGVTGAATLSSTLAVTGVATLTGGAVMGTAQSYFTSAFSSSRSDFTSTSGSRAAIVGQVNPAPAGASTAQYTGVAASVANSNANTSGASAYAFDGMANSSTNIATLAGGLFVARSSGTGTITTAVGMSAIVQMVTAAGTITTGTAVNASGSISGGGTMGTFYGVRVPVSATLATTTWGVYVDAAKSNFGGGLLAGAPVQHASYTVGTLPAAATWPRGEAYCSDETGGATLVFSDGTNWRRHSDRAIAA